MDPRRQQELALMLDQVRVNRTLVYHWVFARFGPDGAAFLGVYRRSHEAAGVAFDLRREADRSRLVQGHVWFLDDEYVFRTDHPDDAGLRYAFDRNVRADGVRDLHPWLQQGRFRVIGVEGPLDDPRAWFDEARWPGRADRVVADLARLGVQAAGAPERGKPTGPGDQGGLGDLGDLEGLDTLDTLDALKHLDDPLGGGG